MGQSLIQMPKSAYFDIEGYTITIRDHKVENFGGLLGKIAGIIGDEVFSHRLILEEFEKHGVSYEAVIEWCAYELEHDTNILESIIRDQYGYHEDAEHDYIRHKNIRIFSKSEKGRNMANQFIEKIRSCENWGELYDELHPRSKFQREMGCRAIKEIEYSCHRV